MDFLFGESGEYTERHLVFLGEWAPWLQALVIVAAVAVLGLTVYNYRELAPTRRRVLMITLRTLVVLTLVAIFYQPAFLEESVSRSRNHLPVLVDVSESMGLPHGDTTRADLVADFLERQQDRWEALSDDNDLAFYAFGEDLAELPDLSGLNTDVSDSDRADAVRPRGKATRLVAALEELRTRYRNRDLGGVLVVTDGIDTTSSGRRGGLDPAAKTTVTGLDAPVYAFTLDDASRLRDLAIDHVAFNGFAFLMNATSLDATIRAHGYDRGSVTVRMTENGEEVAREIIDLIPGETRYPVTFEFVPRKLGKQVYGLVVDALPDEVYAANNIEQVVINVIRDKIRVLQVVGQPSWDERFLRDHLKSDPDIDLISFFILVNPNGPPLNSRETALIPFPARELFEEELGGFDLAIFQNFNYGPFRTRQYLPKIAEFVVEGGAFLMVGGPLSLSAGGYYGTEITDILPVTIPSTFGDRDIVDYRPFKMQVTESGLYHPITRLEQDPDANQRTWDSMVEMEGANVIAEARPNALVLAEHPSLRDARGKPMPMVTIGEVGQGRSMVVATDSTWHWSFKSGLAGGDPRNYDTFWSNAIKWLIKDPELDLIKVHSTRASIPVGEKAKVRIEVFQADYRPNADHPVDLVVRLRKPGDGAGVGDVVLSLDQQKTNGDGLLELELPVERAGIYEVTATSDIVKGRTSKGVDLFVGSELNPEFEVVVGDGRLPRAIAEASEGAVIPMTAAEFELKLREPRITKVASRRHHELWNAPFVILLLVWLLTAEWWLRRKFGYL